MLMPLDCRRKRTHRRLATNNNERTNQLAGSFRMIYIYRVRVLFVLVSNEMLNMLCCCLTTNNNERNNIPQTHHKQHRTKQHSTRRRRMRQRLRVGVYAQIRQTSRFTPSKTWCPLCYSIVPRSGQSNVRKCIFPSSFHSLDLFDSHTHFYTRSSTHNHSRSSDQQPHPPPPQTRAKQADHEGRNSQAGTAAFHRLREILRIRTKLANLHTCFTSHHMHKYRERKQAIIRNITCIRTHTSTGDRSILSHAHTHTYTHTDTHIHAHIHTHTHAHTHTYIHTYTYTYTHTHTHAHTPRRVDSYCVLVCV
jgi:hypothetical protein